MKMSIKTMCVIAIMTAVICVVSPFSIPIPGVVPISLGTLGVYIASSLLGAKKGFIAVLLYLIIGAIGLPVFAQFTGGVSIIAGPTGGYMVGYLLMALLTGWFTDHSNNIVWKISLGMVLGTLACYLLGTIWLAYTMKLDLIAALWAGVIPFIPGDIVKIVLSVSLAKVLRPQLSRFLSSTQKTTAV
ncbi:MULTISPECIES: biotin transporter BioY [Clostridiaceae]|uniref:Biotin transporter n=1 Tax=Clostridium facile TaxID=2763035 RepID=A0ABR7IQL9_9CLOT|nr:MULTISPECIES: biotin transporter BioY [Clostridiaceae]MBC5787440.1 biotin transporter BioY [Clostridium facile]